MWGAARKIRHVHVFVDGGAAPTQARRAAYFADPPAIWGVEGTAAEPAGAALVAPVTLLPPDVLDWAPAIREAGADAVHDGDALLAEVLGLEVGRVVVEDGRPQLRVGVGKHDRSIHAELPGRTPLQALAGVVEEVRRHRLLGETGHPADQLVPERWLRAVAVAHPDLVGAAELRPVPVATPARDLRERRPAAALDGDTLYVFSTGVDTELVPEAADTRSVHGARELVLVVPAGDDEPITRPLMARLLEPARVQLVSRGWRHAPVA